jgi:hypothetical protein
LERAKPAPHREVESGRAPDRLTDEEPLEDSQPTASTKAVRLRWPRRRLHGGPEQPRGGHTLGPQRGDLAEASIQGDNTLDDLTIRDASDASLGMTNMDDIPSDDWAADTGPSASAEETAEGATRRINREESELDPRPEVPGRMRWGSVISSIAKPCVSVCP